MKQSKVVSIKSKAAPRKFWVTHCNVCSKIDGAVEQVKSYDSTRDRAEWIKSGRKVTEYIQHNLEPIKWCHCAFEDEIVEE